LERPTHWPFHGTSGTEEIDKKEFLTTKVVPALGKALGLTDEFGSVCFKRLSESHEKRPHARFSEDDRRVSIYLDWSSTPADAVCLAHEMGHAAHYILSGVNEIPPILRETCAFLGELIVLDALLEDQDPLFNPLLLIWETENQTYLGSDIDDLQRALGAPEAAYIYRWNYPLARLAAVEIFQSYKSGKVNLVDVFKSGAAGMSILPLSQMAARADEIQNYLPPFSVDPASATAAYQSLGAMALLDIDTFEGPSQREIGDVYADLRKNLQDQTAFIGLRDDGRPIGYATWQLTSENNETTLTHQSAPFGDHLKLLQTLKLRFTDAESVSVISQRSARKEQLAW
jgi:hypothetical protein